MAAPGMTLEERARMMRGIAASSQFRPEKIDSALPSSRFQRVDQQVLIERLLDSSDADDFFRLPPFSLGEHASPMSIDTAFKRAGRLVHPDKCKHPRATEAFQRLAHFRAAEVARRDAHMTPLRRDKCEECGAVPERSSMLFSCAGCGRKACHSCNFGLVDKSGGGRSGDKYCYTCVWLDDGMALNQSSGEMMGEAMQRSGWDRGHG
jgi:hypothetical protein